MRNYYEHVQKTKLVILYMERSVKQRRNSEFHDLLQSHMDRVEVAPPCPGQLPVHSLILLKSFLTPYKMVKVFLKSCPSLIY